MDFIFDPSLVLYLPLYELDGASFMSKDIYGHLCTVTGAIWTPQGRSFDGSDDNVNCGNDTALDIGICGGTFVAWLKPAAVAATYIAVMKGGGGAGSINYRLGIDATLLDFRADIGGTVRTLTSAGKPVSVNEWICFSAKLQYLSDLVWTRMFLYIDGIEYAQATYGSFPIITTSNLRIGSSDIPNLFYNGVIGEVLIYNRPLTALEIQRNYLATKWRYR